MSDQKKFEKYGEKVEKLADKVRALKDQLSCEEATDEIVWQLNGAIEGLENACQMIYTRY